MSCSEARLLANRANALKSTGPSTVEGKETSRQNALKHGLTGNGIVIPGEDAGEVALRVEELEAQLAPDGDPMTRLLARRVAALSVRAERSVRHETAVTAERVRNAAHDFDEARRAEADHLLSYAAAEPATNHRRLLATPEGVDLLIATLRRLRSSAEIGPSFQWSDNHAYQLDFCTGRRLGSVPVSRGAMLTDAVLHGSFNGLDTAEIDDLAPKARHEWAADELVRLIDAEIARLEAHRLTLDRDRIALSRAEAGERALVDTGPAAVLARKYEAATERALFRTLQEIRALRRDRADQAPPPPAAPVAQAMAANAEHLPELAEPSPALGSFFPESSITPRPANASMNTKVKSASRPVQPHRGDQDSPAPAA